MHSTRREMFRGRDWYVTLRGPTNTRVVSQSGLRQLEWIFTTPVLLLLVQDLHTFAFSVYGSEMSGVSGPVARREQAYQPVDRVVLVTVDLVMIACGIVMPLTDVWMTLVLYAIAVCAFTFVIFHSLRAIVDIIRGSNMATADAMRVAAIGFVKMVVWGGYPAIYLLTDAGFLSCKQQHEMYLFNDVLTKFSYTLIISCGSMRFLEILDGLRTKEALQLGSVQRAFFFNITHELRTPLNSIIGFNTLAMESGDLTEFNESFIKASLTSAEALLGLINQILDFAKFEGSKDHTGSGDNSAIQLSEDIWTISNLVEQVTDMSQKASSSGVDLVIDVKSPDDFHTKFLGDFFRLRQCCVNLVDNAIKYSSNVKGRTGLVNFTIEVARDFKGKEDASVITFSIEDNGVGIPAAKQHSLFVPFCQPTGHKDTKVARSKGTGLGLVITKSIIECMGGEIDFESVEDEFTKFFFKISVPHSNESETGDETEEFGGVDQQLPNTLASNVRLVLDQSMESPLRRHMTSILRCFKAKPGVHYISVPPGSDLKAKTKQASRFGVPIILTDINNVNTTLDIIKEQTAGMIIFGLPFQLMELHRSVSDMVNVVTVLKPVKPSDFIHAVNKLANSHLETAWMHDSTVSEEEVAMNMHLASENAAKNMEENSKDKDQLEHNLEGMKVLLVEDNMLNQQMAKFSIVKSGALLEVAGHGGIAVNLIKELLEKKLPTFDCILMDMMMPVMDGAAATAKIREMEKEYGVKRHKIIGLSANVGPEYTEQIKTAGMDGNMAKPFYPATLRATLGEVLKGTYRGFSSSRSSIDHVYKSIESRPGN